MACTYPVYGRGDYGTTWYAVRKTFNSSERKVSCNALVSSIERATI